MGGDAEHTMVVAGLEVTAAVAAVVNVKVLEVEVIVKTCKPTERHAESRRCMSARDRAKMSKMERRNKRFK